MKAKIKIKNSKGQTARSAGLVFAFAFCILPSVAATNTTQPTHAVNQTNTAPAQVEAEPETAREFFNAGTRQLRAGKLREAEARIAKEKAQEGRSDDGVTPS